MYVHTYVHMYICTYVLMYVTCMSHVCRMYVCNVECESEVITWVRYESSDYMLVSVVRQIRSSAE